MFEKFREEAARLSPTFGASLWLLDYALQATASHISRLYCHHGTPGTSNYNWWSSSGVNSPFYGSYLATKAMAGVSTVVSLNNGTSNYAAYAIYSTPQQLARVVLINTDCYNGTGTRSLHTFTLTGLAGRQKITATRLTASSAWARQDEGDAPTLGGQSFSDRYYLSTRGPPRNRVGYGARRDGLFHPIGL